MSTEKGYNGWTNYETWLVGLWIDNEESSADYWRERTEEAWRDATPGEHKWQTVSHQACYDLADALKSHFEENAPELDGFWTDLLGAALSEVNWQEIANGMLEAIEQGEVDCEACEGIGELEQSAKETGLLGPSLVNCPDCKGKGQVPAAVYVAIGTEEASND